MKSKLAIVLGVSMVLVFALAGCGGESQSPEDSKAVPENYGETAYTYLQYIDENLPDRDCIGGANYADAQKWIKDKLSIIEEYFPGRAQEHLTTFDNLLKHLLEQESLEW